MMRTLAILSATLSAFLTVVASAQSLPTTAQLAQHPSSPDIEVKAPPSVLILNSYHRGYDWSDAEAAVIEDIFASRRPDARLFFESLDAKRIKWNEQRANTIAGALALKYHSMRFDLIIALDDNAYDFILRFRDGLFGQVPVVFCGVNYFDPARLQGIVGVTGVVQQIDFVGNIRLIKRILPGVSTIWAITDGSLTGKAYRAAFSGTGLPEGINVEFLNGEEIGWQDLLARLSALDKDSAVLKLIWLEDLTSGYIEPDIGYAAIARASSVPVFQVTESGLGQGLAGGLLVTGHSQGRQAAGMALDILAGADPATMPVVTEPECEVRIDWNALAERWGVTNSDYERARRADAEQTTPTVRLEKPNYRICLANDPLFSRYDLLTREFSGMTVELLNLVAAKAGLTFTYVYSEPSKTVSNLRAGRCDAAMPEFTDRFDREMLDMSEVSLFADWGEIYVRSGQPISGLGELKGRSIAVVGDSAFYKPFREQVEAIGMPVNLFWVASYEAAIELLLDGGVDAALVGRFHPISLRKASKLVPTGIIIYPVAQRMVVERGSNADFLGVYDNILSGMIRDGDSDYHRVLGRHTFKPGEKWIPGWAWIVLVAFFVTLIFAVITRRRVWHKTRELREREEKLRVILDSIVDAVVAAGPDGRVIDLNPAATLLTGWDDKDAVGQCLAEVVDLVDQEQDQPITGWVESVLGGNLVQLSSDASPTLLSRRGGSFRIEICATPIRDEVGVVSGIAVVFRDVTESLRTEEIRRQSQKMEAIGQLAGGIAHDFNNVLGGVTGISEFLISRYREDPTIVKYCGFIVESGHRASVMIRRLLDFARMGKVESVAVSVNSVVGAAVELLKGSLPRDIEIVSELLASPDVIIGDGAQIENMVLNLGINARDAMPEGGHIEIRTAVCEPFESERRIGRFLLAPGLYLTISVGDSGIGIAPAVRDKIFEPFYTTKLSGMGTGLGLAAVIGIVEEHQGAVSVESKPDGGTIFTVYLPLSEAEVNVQTSEPEAIQTNYQGVVLVIDDEPIIRTMAQVLLTESGFDVITAVDGRDGLETYMKRRDEIDVVLLDFIMPVMDGMATLRELIAFDPDVRVVIASGFTNDHRKQTLLDAGAVDTVNKPFSQQEICTALINAISR